MGRADGTPEPGKTASVWAENEWGEKRPRRVNCEGLTFPEWDAAARLGEEVKVAPLGEEAARAREAAFRLGGDAAADALPNPSDVRERARLSDRRARRAWKAGEDPTEYAAAPRPLPRERRAA